MLVVVPPGGGAGLEVQGVPLPLLGGTRLRRPTVISEKIKCKKNIRFRAFGFKEFVTLLVTGINYIDFDKCEI
jgi:hypothetical protein